MKRVPKSRVWKPRSGATKAVPKALATQRIEDAAAALAWALRDGESSLAAHAALAIRNRRLAGSAKVRSTSATKGPLDHLPAEEL